MTSYRGMMPARLWRVTVVIVIKGREWVWTLSDLRYLQALARVTTVTSQLSNSRLSIIKTRFQDSSQIPSQTRDPGL